MDNLDELIPLLVPVEEDNSYKDQLRGSLHEDMKIINLHLQYFNHYIKNENFTIFTMEQIINRMDYTGKHYGYTKLIDVGIIYAGMGHVIILTWDRIKQKYFFRLDGGSNGWDRESNEKFFLTKLNLNNEKYKDKLFDGDKVIEIVNNGVSINREMLVYSD